MILNSNNDRKSILQFAKSFAHKYNIDIQIERFDTSEMLIDVIVQDFDYFECETGFGDLLQQYGFKDLYVQKYPEQNLVVSYGNFLYKRVGATKLIWNGSKPLSVGTQNIKGFCS